MFGVLVVPYAGLSYLGLLLMLGGVISFGLGFVVERLGACPKSELVAIGAGVATIAAVLMLVIYWPDWWGYCFC